MQLGWLNSYTPLIVPHFFGSAYLIFLLRQFYRGLPKDYEEAAILDGANYLGHLVAHHPAAFASRRSARWRF